MDTTLAKLTNKSHTIDYRTPLLPLLTPLTMSADLL